MTNIAKSLAAQPTSTASQAAAASASAPPVITSTGSSADTGAGTPAATLGAAAPGSASPGSGAGVVLPTKQPQAPPNAFENIPGHCQVAKTDAVSIIICNPTAAWIDKLLPTAPAFGVSLIALGISLAAFRYTRKKDKTAREQSIKDDFWLRKVLSPSTIEPWVKLMGEMLTGLPAVGVTTSQLEEWKQSRLSQIRAIGATFVALRLIDEALFEKVERAAGDVEDRLVGYLSEMAAHLETGAPAPSRPEAVAELATMGVAVLIPIKEHQTMVGGG